MFLLLKKKKKEKYLFHKFIINFFLKLFSKTFERIKKQTLYLSHNEIELKTIHTVIGKILKKLPKTQ